MPGLSHEKAYDAHCSLVTGPHIPLTLLASLHRPLVQPLTSYFDFHHLLKVDEMVRTNDNFRVLFALIMFLSCIKSALYKDGYLVLVQFKLRLSVLVEGVSPRVILPPVVIKLKLGC